MVTGIIFCIYLMNIYYSCIITIQCYFLLYVFIADDIQLFVFEPAWESLSSIKFFF